MIESIFGRFRAPSR